MSVEQVIERGYVDLTPVKSFFVNMLTRDIPLFDAILDLLDNCVDGIIRSRLDHVGDHPYKDFYAHIEFNEGSFTISDNCGGIPSNLIEYAFRLGRPAERVEDSPGSVGVYGIGMKRAIFKMGRECLISTQNPDKAFEVSISPEWIGENANWHIPLAEKDRVAGKPNGTVVYISELYDNIGAQFGADKEAFTEELERLISTHYAFIIAKGFEVTINGVLIVGQPTRLLFDDGVGQGIRPFIFEATIEEVEIYLIVGFTIPIPSTAEIEDEQEESRYKSTDAGWTVICNDRAVVYRDRSELTGWGDAGVPAYHTQFIAIAGIVEFRSTDPKKLPTTTTKRGIDSSSRLYLQIKNKMREGMQLFTTYTNRWKGNTEATKVQFRDAKPMTLDELKTASKALTFAETKNTRYPGLQYKPNLPMPEKVVSDERKITYKVSNSEYTKVAKFLLDDEDAKTADVGLASFKHALRSAR